jgi:hypothetical protein
MKKVFFVAFSVMLAVVLFAFTSSQKQSSGTPDPQYYWYEVSYDGSTPKIEEQSPMSHNSTIAQVSFLYDCPGDDRVCKAGFLEPLTFVEGNPIYDNTDGDENANFKEANPSGE